jgi:hypothetical protein
MGYLKGVGITAFPPACPLQDEIVRKGAVLTMMVAKPLGLGDWLARPRGPDEAYNLTVDPSTQLEWHAVAIVGYKVRRTKAPAPGRCAASM